MNYLFTEELSRIVGIEKIMTLPFIAALCFIAVGYALILIKTLPKKE